MNSNSESIKNIVNLDNVPVHGKGWAKNWCCDALKESLGKIPDELFRAKNPREALGETRIPLYIIDVVCLIAMGRHRKARDVVRDNISFGDAILVAAEARLLLYNKHIVAGYALLVASALCVEAVVAQEKGFLLPFPGGESILMSAATWDINAFDAVLQAGIIVYHMPGITGESFQQFLGGVAGHRFSSFSLLKILDVPLRWTEDLPRTVLQGFVEEMDQEYEDESPLVLPEIMPVKEAFEEMRDHSRYSLWPGTTIVLWDEGDLREIRLLYFPGSSACVGGVVTKNGEMLVTEVPMPADEESWEATLLESSHTGSFRLCVEAMRMILVAKEKKISQAGNRVPSGAVRGTRSPRKKDINVQIIPRVEYIRQESLGTTHSITLGSGKYDSLPRRIHEVSWHLRQLAEKQRASQQARELSESFGIALPENGWTFVRPHVRGSSLEPKIVKKRL